MDKTKFMNRVFRDADYYLTSPFSPRRINPVTGVPKPHNGEDYGTHRLSVPIYSPVWGRVVRSAWNDARGWYLEIKAENNQGYVLVQHLAFRYIVLATIAKFVTPSNKIGNVGNSGRSTATHLHIEYYNADHQIISPSAFITAYKDPVYPTYEVTASVLNVRNKPGTSGTVVSKLNKGTKVKVYAVKDGWAKISYNSERWVSMDYIRRV